MRFYHLGYNSLWLDEATTYLYAQKSFLEIWGITTGGEFNPPVFYWIEHVMLIFGNSEPILRLVPAILGVLTIPLFYLIGKELVDEDVGLIAAALISFSPFHIYYSQEARAYTTVLFFMSLALIYYLRARDSRELKYWILFGIFSAFAFWTHFYSFIIIGTLILFELIVQSRKILKNPSEFKPILYALAVFTAISLPLLIVAVRYLLIRTSSSPAFGSHGIKFLYESAWQIFGYNNIAELFLITLFIIGIVQLFRTDSTKFQLWTTVIVVALLASLLLSYKMPMVPRYLIILLPFIYTAMAAAYGTAYALTSHRAILYLLIIALFAVGMPFYHEYYTSYSRSDWNGLATELRDITHDGDLVVVLPEYIRNPLDYYYNNASDRTIEYGASTEEDLERLCESGEHARVFFVSTADIFAEDPTRRSYQWLQTHSFATKRGSRNTGKMASKIWIYQMINKSDPVAWFDKGQKLISQGKYNEAIKCFNEAVEINPLYANAWCYKGKALYKLGKYEEAIKAFDRAIEVDPLFAVAWNNKGLTLSSLGKYDDAFKCYDKAIEINPEFALAWYNKGRALYKLGKHNESLRAYNRAIEINPKLALAWYNKGIVLNALGHAVEARNAFNRARAISA
ncbi:MAG: tetratricopeptide repeat protein [Methanotrichaceae archaeon]